MPRPPRCRRIAASPRATYFKPRGVPLRELSESYLPVEGLEAIRLADLESLTMEEAAARMNVSRHTFGRILARARRAVAEALVNARALCIEGGEYIVREQGGQASPRPPKEPDMTIVAVTAEEPGLDSPIDPRFGRAAGFAIVNLATMEAAWVDNGSSQAMAHGAGIQAAENIAAAGAGVLLTGYVGPKAFTALTAAGIKVGQDLSGVTVREAVERFKAGKVPFADGPNK